MQLWPVGFILFAASLLPVQAALNAALNRSLRMPAAVVLVSLTCSALTILAVAIPTGRLVWRGVQPLGTAPAWAWLGGICGAVFLLTQPVVVPRLGAGLYMGLSVTGQVVAAILLDHFGAMQVPVHPVSVTRVCGVVLMAAGVALVARG